MGLRAAPFNFRATGCSDAVDGSAAFPGAMRALTNLIPNPNEASQFIPRPAAVSITNFSGFNTPLVPNALMIVGDFAWGLVPSSRFAGKDEPFCYDILGGLFVTLANVTAANCPTSPPSSGEWTPPTMAMITNGRIMITHPGYDGLTNFVGWIDLSAANLTGITGSTHTSTTIDTLSSNPITAGWQVGMQIAGAGVPAGTYIVALGPASVTLSQAATATAAGVALTVTGGTAAAPLYGAGNVNGNPFTSTPKAVAQYNSRAWYAVGNYVVYSDTLNPNHITAAAQALQVGDSQPVTALAGLPLTSQVNGGTLQALIVFKGAAAFSQITGDAATGNLVKNEVSGSVGTLAPNTICATPQGLAFISPNGLRILGLDGVVKPAIGTKGRGIATPFSTPVAPSRMCAAYNSHTVRISFRNTLIAGSPDQEWWYDTELDRWTGPHTFPNALIRPYFGTAVGPFIHAGVGVVGALWTSYSEPPASATYTENGVALSFTWTTILLPDNQQSAMNSLAAQSSLAVQIPSGLPLTVLLADEAGGTLDTVYVNGPLGTGAIWASFLWGGLAWGPALKPFQQVLLNWNQPVVFKQLSVQITGPAMGGLILGDVNAQVQTLGYMLP